MTNELLRIGKILYPEEEFKRVCYWILSCIQLEFSDSMIVAAHFDQRRFNHITNTALQHMVEVSCVKIQSIFRRFEAVKQVQIKLDAKRKVRQARLLAKIRARNRHRKTRRGQAFILNSPEETLRFTKFTAGFAPTASKKKERVAPQSLPPANKSPTKKVVMIDAGADEAADEDKAKKEKKNKTKSDYGRKKSNFGGSDRLQESIQGIGESNNLVYHSRFDTNNQIKNLRKEISGTLTMFEDEIVSLKSELESQKLNFFYGPTRGGAPLMGYNPNDDEGYGGKGEGSDMISGLSSRSGFRDHSTLQMKEDVESLKNKINELELHLALQHADAQMIEQKAKEEIAKSEEHASLAIEQAVAKAKAETIEEMETQLTKKQKELKEMEEKFMEIEKKNEENLQQEIASKYKALEDKLQADFIQVTQRQEQLRIEMSEMLQKQKDELEKLNTEQKKIQQENDHLEEEKIHKTIHSLNIPERGDTRESDEVFSEYDGDDMSNIQNVGSISTKYHLRQNNLKDAALGLKRQTMRDAGMISVPHGLSKRNRAVEEEDMEEHMEETANTPVVKNSNNNTKSSNRDLTRNTSNLNEKKEVILQPAPVFVPPPVETKKAGFFGWLFGGPKKKEIIQPEPFNFAPPPQALDFHFGDNKEAGENISEAGLAVENAQSDDGNLADRPFASMDRKSSVRGLDKRRGSFMSMQILSSSNLDNGEAVNSPDSMTPRTLTRPNSAKPLSLELVSRGSARPLTGDVIGGEFAPPPSPSQSAAHAVSLIGSLLSSTMLSSTKNLSNKAPPGTANSSVPAVPQLSTLDEFGSGDAEMGESDSKDEEQPPPAIDHRLEFVRKIQRGTRRWIHEKKCNQDPDLMQTMIMAMMPLVNGTRHEKIIERSLLMSIQSKNNELANNTINRIVELLLKFDKKGKSFPINLSHIMVLMKQHLKDEFIVNKGFSSMYLMMKGAVDNFEVEPYVQEMAEVFLIVFETYGEDGTVCYKLFKCLYRVIEMSSATASTFATPAMADILRRGFEFHHNKSNVLENILKATSNLAQECAAGRDVLGQMRLGDCLLMSLMNHYETEKLLMLHCKGIMNLCINNHFVNQDLFSRGIYPNIFVKLLVMFRGKNSILPCLIRTIVSIAVNNELVMTKYQSAGLNEVLLDLLIQPGQELPIIKLCAWALSNVISYRQPALRPMHQRVLQILHHCQQHFDGTDVGDEVKKAVLRMVRPNLRASTPFAGEFYGKEMGLEKPERKMKAPPSFNANSPAPSPIPQSNSNSNQPKQFTFSTRSVKSSPSNSIAE